MALHPDDTSLTFVARWNTLISALLVEPSVKLVARTVVDYGLRDGEGVYPGNQRIARQTGLGEKTVREAWHMLRGLAMAVRDNRTCWTGSKRLSDLYHLEIPADWRRWATLGPNFARFHCQHCGKVFNPQPCTAFFTEDGRPVYADKAEGVRKVGWELPKACFCPPGRGQKQSDCLIAGARSNRNLHEPAEAWALFAKAREDDWPVLEAMTPADLPLTPAMGIRGVVS